MVQELENITQLSSSQFCVLGIYAQFCRFKNQFLDRFNKVSESKTYRDAIEFFSADVEQFPELIEKFKVVGTPALVIISKEQYAIHHGNFNMTQCAALINIELTK